MCIRDRYMGGYAQSTRQVAISSGKAIKAESTKAVEKHLMTISKKRKTACMRKAAGEKWLDESLNDWPENDYRIFVGNLGNEVNDETLTSAFRKYPSLLKAKTVRDSRTGRSKGYGFVSLGSMEDYIRAMKEMNNKHIGNRPVNLKKSTWKDRCLVGGKSKIQEAKYKNCLLYTSPSPRDLSTSRMPSSA
eukprot:TRINITY_DN38078_c0_g1_i2.p2 TRINITY_DN38078_c0_g1~~TRINITY_DN38078_c0_g1_i2.p2  ORF type:complete len:190 (-),score=43.58 TRINITY_DN38078_c0_g1_i2:85-654(-)